MKIEARIKKLEDQNSKQKLKVFVGTESEIQRIKSLDDESFLKETGIDRAVYDLVIYVVDQFESNGGKKTNE